MILSVLLYLWIVVIVSWTASSDAFLVSRASHSSTSWTGRPQLAWNMVADRVQRPPTAVSFGTDYSNTIKDLRKAKSPKKIVQYVQEYTSQHPDVDFNFNLTMMAIKALQACNRSDLILPIFEIWQNTSANREDLWNQNVTTLWLVKLFCKLNHTNIAERLIQRVEQTMPTIVLDENNKNNHNHTNTSVKGFLEDLYQNMAFGFAACHRFDESLKYLQLMRTQHMTIELEISKKLLKLFLKGSTSTLIRTAVYSMLKLNGLMDIDSLQMLLGSYIKSVDFVKGAVSMDTLPAPSLPEVTFIGRSNVGKSSLINMVTNRKNLAFTSKMAGKTTELNYFIAKGVVGANKEESQFYLVDVPGVGYAQRSKVQKASWKELFERFLQERTTLQCVFHLIDSRHGLLDADFECLDLLRVLPSHVNYIFVFTKLDKYKHYRDFTKASPINIDIMNKIDKEVQLRTSRKIPMIYTSAETRLGGVELLLTILNSCK